MFLDGLSLGEHNLQDKLLERFPNVDYTEYPITKPEQTLERAKGATIVLTNKVILDKKKLNTLKDSLKLVCITATGMNNVDLEAAKDFGIVVKNVAGYSTKSVAQHTLMFALALSAKLPLYDFFCKQKHYASSALFTNLAKPLELLEGKKWGIIGLGAIGKEVAKLASAFGAEVCYYSTSGKNLDAPYPHKSLESLLKECFVVSIHAPLNEKTKNLLNKNNLQLMQNGAILINVGRGGIVNEEDLAKELEKRDLYAGFDVFTKEPMPENHPFLNPEIANQLLLTPHNAWGYEQSKQVLIEGIIRNIAEFF